MSVDFMSVVVIAGPARARELVGRVERAECLGDVVGDGGATIHDFSRQGDRLSLLACKRAMRGRAPCPEDLAAAYLEGIPAQLLPSSATYVSSANFPLLSVIDRVIALPHGVSFLRGHAYRRFRPKARDRGEAAWRALLARMGGERAIAKRIAPYVDRGDDAYEDAKKMTRAIARGFERARERQKDLVFLGCLASETL